MLWIALHLPLLSLEAFAATTLRCTEAADSHHPVPPLALMDSHHISHANAAARALGIKPGLKRATALALAPQLLLGQADPARDAPCLDAVAHAALAFTPSVTIQPLAGTELSPHTVLLEVQASLRYFGGLPALLQRLHAALAPLGHQVNTVAAPTAQGAALLARVPGPKRQGQAGRGQGPARAQGSGPAQGAPPAGAPPPPPSAPPPSAPHYADLPALRHALDAAPVWLLGPGRAHWEALQGMGLRSLGDLRRLPRSGLARRFSQALLDELDCARGERPDPRESLTLPPTFDSRLELFARADTTEQVLYGAQVLLQRLVVWLAARHAFVRRFTLVMLHEGRQRSHRDDDLPTPRETRLDIALAEPSRDATHLSVLLRERLAPLQLPAPTLDLQLRASDLAHRAAPNGELFPSAGSEREGLVRLIERLQARLGAAQVQRLVCVQDHRPERASRTVAAQTLPCLPAVKTAARARSSAPLAGGSAAISSTPLAPDLTPDSPTRPVWLLDPPQGLHEQQLRPWLDGRPLQLLSGPERIESGWWDAGLVARDYFIAQTTDGALVWLYRTRLPQAAAQAAAQAVPGWFLHGRFA